MGSRMIINTKVKRTSNFLLLTNYSINRSEVEIIKNNGNSSNHHIYDNNKNNDDNNQSHSTPTISISSRKQEEEELLLSPFAKRVLIVDDDTDITFTFKKGLEAENSNKNNKTFFKVYTYNNPLEALSQFKPDFYDLLLVDINMPKMNGFEFSTQILELDVNVRVCFMSSGLINQEALREQYPTLSIGCFIKKPVTIEYLVRRVKEELE
ncbi:MAG TPA: response regulator [Nitrososphaeraceae archaeon]|nr:response regulator [Nitrososphaeraceae archaeon]